jgi:hypothetical protein
LQNNLQVPVLPTRRQPAHCFGEVFGIAQEFAGARGAEVGDPSRHHHHPVRIAVEYSGDDGVVLRDLPIRPGVDQLPIGLFRVLAVPDNFQTLEVLVKRVPHLSSQAEGPFIVKSADQDRRLFPQV